MENKNDIPNEIENIAPFLSKIKKENHFSAPKNYFEVLPEVMNYKTQNISRLQFSFDKLAYRFLVPITSLVVILVLIFNWTSNNTETELSNEQLAELIIEEEYLEIDDYLVYDAYEEIMDEEENEIESETEEYINYLLENNININLIIEEL